MFGRVKMYNLGFAVFTVGPIPLSVTSMHGCNGALWLIALRVVQGIGGALPVGECLRHPHRRVSRQGSAGWPWASTWLRPSPAGSPDCCMGGALAPIAWRLVFRVCVPMRRRSGPPGPTSLHE